MTDSLLQALVTIGRLHSKPVNREAVVAGLPLVKGKLTPDLFVRAAERAGFSARIVKRSPGKLHAGLLPAVLVLEGNQTAILIQRQKQKSEVIYPETGEGANWVDTSTLEADYAGFAIVIQPSFQFEERSLERTGPKRSRSWFWGTLWKFRRFYARVAVASVALNFFALASSIFIMTVYDRVIPHQALETLYVLAWGFGVVLVFEFILKLLRALFVDRASQRADVLLAGALYEHILGVKFSSRPGSAGAFASQVRSYETLREFFTSATLNALVDLPFVLLFVFVVYLLGGIMALPLLIAVVLTLIMGLVLQWPLAKAVRQGHLAANQRHALVVEAVTSLETIKAVRAESEMQHRLESSVRESSNADANSRWIASVATSIAAFLQQATTIALVILGVFQIMEGSLSMGGLIAIVILTGRAMAPLARVTGLFTRLQQSLVALRSLNEVMRLPAERSEHGEVKAGVPDFEAAVNLKGVTFAYSQEAGPALDDVSLEIRPGEKVAIMGRVGSGKSTVLKLAMGLLEPDDGIVQVSGLDLRQIDPADLRRHVGYVSQHASLLYGTVGSNIIAGVPWASEEQLWKAAKISGVENFVRAHPKGLQMPVGERGEQLSGGQRQAIAIARALVGDPDLLLLDEPTSGMDVNSQRDFIEQLLAWLEARGEVTLILATHRIELLQAVDRVIVLGDGKVHRDGPRDQILNEILSGKNPKTGEAA